MPEPIPFTDDPEEKRRRGDDWLHSGRSLLASVPSAVIPEAQIIMMNPHHPDAARIAPLKTRVFDFAATLHLPKG